MTLTALAKKIATDAHRGQTRRDGTPYIAHPARVAALVAHHGEVVEAVAWLHDVIEDTSYSAIDLHRMGVPWEVVSAVKDLTKVEGGDPDAYLARIKASPISRAVKIADMLDNLSDKPTESARVRYLEGLKLLALSKPLF